MLMKSFHKSETETETKSLKPNRPENLLDVAQCTIVVENGTVFDVIDGFRV